MKNQRISRVRIFVDYWNFAKCWQKIFGYLPDKNLDWSMLPQAVLDALDEMPNLRNTRKELRAVKIYSSLQPSQEFNSDEVGLRETEKLDEEKKLKEWFQDYLDQLTAYTVDITQRSDSPIHCEVCKSQNSHFVEQGVDTKIAIDLVSLASSDLYDIAVLVSNDGDLVPSVQCVQDSLDKQVVHLGFREVKTDVRTEAWGHLFVDDMFAEIVKS